MSLDSAGFANSDALDAFMVFPAPLALLDPAGHPELVNARFRDRFSVEELNEATLRMLAHDPNGIWHDVGLTRGDAESPAVRARAVRTSHRVLLIVDDPDGGEHNVDAMRARINDLERLTTTDYLTGAWNRKHLDRVIESELPRSLATRQPLSLILLDLDHFKKINDTFGHVVGDIVLRELVRLVRSNTRTSDLLFRWGGEEFVVLVSAAGYRRAEIVADKLRQTVAGHTFDGAGTVTVSLGVAERDGDEDANAWFRRLDDALYEAKGAGRNRVIVARRGNSDRWAAEGGVSALHLVWQEGYECGDPTIDDQHRELFEFGNNLIAASLQQPADLAAIKAAVDALLVHVTRHFADEEAILARLHYDQLEEHQRAHAGLVRRALAMAAKLEAREVGAGAIVEFLAQDVVARHLMAVDRAFFPLFRRESAAPQLPQRG